jgi:hypothetical protein
MTDWQRDDGDPDGVRIVARTFVWARWVIVAFGLALWVYRPVDSLETCTLYVPGILLLIVLNGYTHYRLGAPGTASDRANALTVGGIWYL